MKKTKSLLAFFLATMMCLSLAACGGDKGPKSYTLNAEDADLSAAENVIVEPDKAPYNLGGWTYYDVVVFNFTGIEQDGNYSITLNYSKASSDGDETLILVKDRVNNVEIKGKAAATGADWSTYQDYTMPGNVFVSGGKTELAIEADFDHEGDHFLNLRSITLTYVGEGSAPAPTPSEPEADAIDLYDIEGWWKAPEYPDSFYFDRDGFWETYETDGSLFLQGDIIDNGDSTFTLHEDDLGEYGELVADEAAGTLILYTTDNYTFHFESISQPGFSGGDDDDDDVYNSYIGEWEVYEDGELASVVFYDDLTMDFYADDTWIGEGQYDPDSDTFYGVDEDGYVVNESDMYYDAAADQVNLNLDGRWYTFDRA